MIRAWAKQLVSVLTCIMLYFTCAITNRGLPLDLTALPKPTGILTDYHNDQSIRGVIRGVRLRYYTETDQITSSDI